mmetsp:Transcript_11112/g.20398  ORF Transcript_11112/g.20398 Transcript_11112/m.20398 type:complete len:143 (+) Transcript_11112:52-480(+)
MRLDVWLTLACVCLSALPASLAVVNKDSNLATESNVLSANMTKAYLVEPKDPRKGDIEKMKPVTVLKPFDKAAAQFRQKQREENSDNWSKKLTPADTKKSPLGRLIHKDKKAMMKAVKVVDGLHAPKQKPVMDNFRTVTQNK